MARPMASRLAVNQGSGSGSKPVCTAPSADGSSGPEATERWAYFGLQGDIRAFPQFMGVLTLIPQIRPEAICEHSRKLVAASCQGIVNDTQFGIRIYGAGSRRPNF